MGCAASLLRRFFSVSQLLWSVVAGAGYGVKRRWCGAAGEGCFGRGAGSGWRGQQWVVEYSVWGVEED